MGSTKLFLSETCQNVCICSSEDVIDDKSTYFLVWSTMSYASAWNGRPWPGRSQNWMLMYFIINLSGSQQFSGRSIQNQVELSEWATGRFMHCLCMLWYHLNTLNSTGKYLAECWEYIDSKFDCSAAALLILDACQIWGKLDNQTWRSGLTDSHTLLWECIQCTRYTLVA